MSSCDTQTIPKEKQVDCETSPSNRFSGNVSTESTFTNETHLPENSEINYSSIFFKAKAHSEIPKAEKHNSSEHIDMQVSSCDSSTPCIFESSMSDSSPRIYGCLQVNKSGEITRFEVTKITKGKTKKETLLLSEKGITNINPRGMERSLERWSDVLLCYKVDELTVAIKYRKGERRYKTQSWNIAQNLFNAVWIGMNAQKEYCRTQPKKSMIDGFDQKEAVPELKKVECHEENFDEIHKFVEQILLWPKSKVFKLKQNICNFPLSDLRKVKELRMYLDQFKYKIFAEYRMEFWAKIDLSDPTVHQRTLCVIERVVERTCMPHHIDKIHKVLRSKYKSPKNLISKVDILCKKPQGFFGIDKRLRSKGEWLNAVLELQKYPNKMLPSSKMECLLRTTRYIHQEAKQYKKEITGDDILPIVIYVIVKASERSQKLIFTEADQKFIEILISPEALQGKCGYYLCVFSAGSEYIRNYHSQRNEEKFNNIQRLRSFGVF